MAKKAFLLDETSEFAQLSGDYNPMHLDPVAARRLVFGRPVAHGISAVLWALEQWLKDRGRIIIRSITVSFEAPIGAGETAEYRPAREEQDRAVIHVMSGGARAAAIQLVYSPAGNAPSVTKGFLDTPPKKKRPRVLTQGHLAAASGAVALGFDPELAGELYPELSRKLDTTQLAVLLATTRVIGMECPGLHSIFSELDLHFGKPKDSQGRLAYRTKDFDCRFSRVILAVKGPGVSGTLTALFRPPPRAQPAFADLRSLVNKDEFHGQRALVVGGSRGLGEVSAKLLAAGGAEVRITCHRGEDDARRVVREICAGGGIVDYCPLDVTRYPSGLAETLAGHETPTHVYYFATPPIFVAKKAKFSHELFAHFCRFYVDGFERTVTAVAALGAGRTKFFYPSSVAVEDIPANMGEYAAAKAAGECLCKFLNKAGKCVEIDIERLPRLATDQTASILGVEGQDPVPVMLGILRRLR